MALSFKDKVGEVFEVVETLLENEVITMWEAEYVGDMYEDLPFNPTERQEEVLDNIYEKVCQSPF